ncbi:Fic/DOC family protein [Dinoroseobacter sp. S76]|uniref:Fic/DOC family protein n=1 Tax=Dinoroseobacter sp. S76 TaxID=3415124 RepID=UPI003C7E87A6
MSDPVYCYPPEYDVLRNKFGIKDASILDRVERRSSALRISQGCPRGDFDLAHLKAIHGHIFQDTYDWAGETRTVEISKGGSQFIPRQFIETGMADVHRRLAAQNHLKDLSPDQFAHQAGQIIGDINHIHPFREGNGRTQLQYLSQFGEQAGHRIDLRKLEPDAWMEASIRSHEGDYNKMSACIRGALESDPSLEIQDESYDRPQFIQEDYAKALRQSQESSAQPQKAKDQEIE